ncbi:MAG TPA: YceI family protein [Emticicia sp.]
MISRLAVIFPLLFILVTGFVSGSNGDEKSYIARWVVAPGGSMVVEGSTNVNKFKCQIVNYNKPDTIIIYKNSGSKEIVALSGNIKLNVQSFDCHNPVMTGDLRKTLKAKEHPYLSIKFVSLNKLPANQYQEAIKGMVDIQLAGVTKRFDVNYKFSKDGQNMMDLIGTRTVNFSDFDLTPPRKLGGMIQTNNELKVEFRLKLKILNGIKG